MAQAFDPESAIARAARIAGSQTALARLIGKPQPTVNGWIKSGRVHHEHVLAVEAATGISRHDLRPDIYPREPAPAGHDATRMEPAR